MTIYKSATIQVLDSKNDSWDVLISTDDEDRAHDTVEQSGWEVNAYMRNPVVMWSHDYHGFTPAGGVPVGITHALRLDALGLIANFSFRKAANEGDFVNIVRSAWEQEVLRAASVGFNPIEMQDNQMGGKHFRRQELLEWSICAIPMNSASLRRSYEQALKAAGMEALLNMRAKTSQPQADIEPITADPVDEATITDIQDATRSPSGMENELTPAQEQALAEALAALTIEMTDLFTEA